MPKTTDRSAHLVTTPGSRTAGFVLGANWHRPEALSPAPQQVAERMPPEATSPGQILPVIRLENAPAIFQGIITHYVEPDLRPKLKGSSDSLRLVEDLGLDSLSMVEIMMRVEDLLQIHVSDEELRHFRTLGEVRRFVDRTARAMSAPMSGVLPAS